MSALWTSAEAEAATFGHVTRAFEVAGLSIDTRTLKPGDHVVAPKVMYWSLRNWLMNEATRWGLKVDLVEASDGFEAFGGSVVLLVVAGILWLGYRERLRAAWRDAA